MAAAAMTFAFKAFRDVVVFNVELVEEEAEVDEAGATTEPPEVVLIAGADKMKLEAVVAFPNKSSVSVSSESGGQMLTSLHRGHPLHEQEGDVFSCLYEVINSNGLEKVISLYAHRRNINLAIIFLNVSFNNVGLGWYPLHDIFHSDSFNYTLLNPPNFICHCQIQG